MNLDGSTISVYEKGTRQQPPDRATVIALEDALGVTDSRLLEAAGFSQRRHTQESVGISDEVTAVVSRQRRFRREHELSGDQIDEVERYIDWLLERDKK